MSRGKRKSSVAKKMSGILICLGVITGLMFFLNLMACQVLQGFSDSLKENVLSLTTANDTDKAVLADEAANLLNRIDLRISGTYVFNIVLLVLALIVTIIAIIVSMRMIVTPTKNVSKTLDTIVRSFQNNEGDLTVRATIQSNDELVRWQMESMHSCSNR